MQQDTEKRYGTYATRSSRRSAPTLGDRFSGSNGQKWEIIEVGPTRYYSLERLEDTIENQTDAGDAWGWLTDYVCVEAAS